VVIYPFESSRTSARCTQFLVRPRPLDINEDIDLQYQSVLLNDMPHATPPPDAVRWKRCVCHRSDNREEICIGVSGDQHWEHKRSDCEKCKKFPPRTKSMGERLLENVPVTMGTEELGEGTRNSAPLSDKRATKVSHNNQLDVPDFNDRILIWECKCGNSNDGSEAQIGVTKREKCRRKFKTSLKFSARLKVTDKKREVVDTTNLRQPFDRF
jgi:hypothetical protein